MSVTSVAHSALVRKDGGRYPFRPMCSCGWEAQWGYVAAHAAQSVAEAHVDKEVER